MIGVTGTDSSGAKWWERNYTKKTTILYTPEIARVILVKGEILC